MKKYLNQKEVLFVIPARSGSKGVKNKNLQICAGESLLRRAVNLALEIDVDSRVIVSTDSEDYIEHKKFISRIKYSVWDKIDNC